MQLSEFFFLFLLEDWKTKDIDTKMRNKSVTFLKIKRIAHVLPT